jgi:hypothetical protein
MIKQRWTVLALIGMCGALATMGCSHDGSNGSGDAGSPMGGSAGAAGRDGSGGGRGATTDGGGTLCPGLGWCEVTNTKLREVCSTDPAVQGVMGCKGVTGAWGGGIADQTRNRLIVWGGGHNDYYGNEIYAFNLDGLTVQRLNEPSAPNPTPKQCIGVLPDNTPNSRHSYNGLAYLRHSEQMLVFSGAIACQPGGFSNDTWTLDLASLRWTLKDPTHGGPPAAGVPAMAYDPVSRLAFVHDTAALWTYDDASNTYTRVIEDAAIDYHLTAEIDLKRRLLILFGGGQVRAVALDKGTYQMQTWDTLVTGCNPIRDAAYPGLAYDPVQGLIVGWAGGDAVYLFDPDAKACTAVTHGGGPGPQQDNGTNGRFRYFEQQKAFVVLNDVDQNVFSLRLTP